MGGTEGGDDGGGGNDGGGSVTRKKRALSDGPLPVIDPTTEDLFVKRMSMELRDLGRAKDKKYNGYGAFVKDHANIMDLSEVLRNALIHDIGVCPITFHALLVSVMSRNLNDEVTRRLASGIIIADFARGTTPHFSHFTDKPTVGYPKDHTPEYLAQRMREAMGQAHQNLQLLLSQQRRGQVALENIWANSLTAKNGRMTRGAISVFSDFGFVMSPSSMDKYLNDEALGTWYRNYIEGVVAKAKQTVERMQAEGDEEDYPVLYRSNLIIMERDNNNPKVWAKQPGQKIKVEDEMQRKQLASSITSSTTNVAIVEKPPYFQMHPNRAQAQTLFREQERKAATDVIQSGAITLPTSVFDEMGAHRRQKTGKQHLSDWDMIASDDQKSSSHAHNAVFFEAVFRFLGASELDKKEFERTGNEVYRMINEIGLVGDTEYCLVARKLVHLYPEKFRQMFLLWPPFHACMHGIELWKDNPIVLVSLWAPLCRFLEHKLKTFGVGGIMDNRIDSIFISCDVGRTMIVHPHNKRASTMLEHVDDDSDDEEEQPQTNDADADDQDQVRLAAVRWTGVDLPVTMASVGSAVDAFGAELAASASNRSVSAAMSIDDEDEWEYRVQALKWKNTLSLSHQMAVFCEGTGLKRQEHETFVIDRSLAQQQGEKGCAKTYQTFKGSAEVVKHSQQVDSLVDANASNYCRTILLASVLGHAAKLIDSELSRDGSWDKNEATKLLRHLLIDILYELFISPPVQQKCFGDLIPTWNAIPKVIQWIAFGGRKNVVRALHYVLAQFLHLSEFRDDILRLMAEIGTIPDELYIEHANAQIDLMCKSLGIVDYPGLRVVSAKIAKKRHDKKQMNKYLERSGTAGLTSAAVAKLHASDELQRNDPPERDSEVASLQRRFLKDGSQYPLVLEVAEWLTLRIRVIGRETVRPDIEAVLANYRPLDMVKLLIDESHREGEAHLATVRKNETAAQAAMQANITAPIQSPRQLDQFDHFLNDGGLTMNATIKPIWKRLKQQGGGALNDVKPTIEQGKNAPKKSGFIEAIRKGFEILYPADSPQTLIQRFKSMCDLTAPDSIAYPATLKTTWVAGIMAPVPKEKECLYKVYASMPDKQTIHEFNANLFYDGPRLYPS